LATLAISAMTAPAASVPDPVSGDIFLAFRASGGDGSDVSYLVKLGQSSQFTGAAAGTSFTLGTIGNIGTDLTATFGTTTPWHTRQDLFWGIFGTTDAVNPTLYASQARVSTATQTPPWPELTTQARTSVKTEILSVTSGIGGYRSSSATANSAVATLQSNFGGAASYNYQVTNSALDFGSQSQWSSIEGSFSAGVSGAVLDLYRLRNASPTVSYIGKFTISTAGVVTFTAAPAAPPSTVDTDGDGFTDAQEAAAGTNPNDPSDFFRVQSVQFSAGVSNTVRFNTAASRIYSIEYSQDLVTGGWIVVGSYTAGASGSLYSFVDTDPVRIARANGFYRVKVTQ
jgi:hypothetical protein